MAISARAFHAGVLIFALGGMLHAADEPASIWQIGNFDRSSGEFAQRPARKGLVFEIRKSDPANDWTFLQAPGADNSRTIQFSLDAGKAPAYRLQLAFLIERPGLPAVRIEINGHEGLFFLHPELDYNMGDRACGGHAGYSHADLTVDLPAKYFQNGENRLTLTTVSLVDQPSPDMGLVYDALDFRALTAPPAAITTEIEPTIFYRNVHAGLSERIDVFVRHDTPASATTLDLEIGGHHYRNELKETTDFGEDRAEFFVLEFSQPMAAHLTVARDDQKTTLSSNLTPARKWTIYVVPHIHVDVGYTDYQAKIGAVQARVIDEALDLIAQHPEFRYSMDGSWCLEQFLASRGSEDQQRAIKALQKGRIFFPAEYENPLTGFPPAEALIRSLYPSANFSRTYHVPLDYTTITDVPSYSASYPSILAAAGIKYLLAGSNNDHGPILIRSRFHEASPMWWEGPDGKRVLLWYAFVYRQVECLFGQPSQVSTGEQMLPIFLQSFEKPEYRPHAVLLYGTQGENHDLFPQQAVLAQQWNRQFVYPHLQYAGFSAALAAIATQCGNSIPTIRGDGGPYWEDGIASDAASASLERSTEARAPSGEKFATAATIINSRLSGEPAARTEIWKNIAMSDEHTFDSSDSVADPQSDHSKEELLAKEAYATRAHDGTLQVLRSSLADLADAIPVPSDSLIVFNSLNWKRDGLVDFDLHRGTQIVDQTTGKPVPCRVLFSGNAFQRVEFLAETVPPMGYKVYSLRHGPTAQESSMAKSDAVLENKFYRLELDPTSGAVASLYDKELQRELVDRQSPYRFAQYLYVTGGDTPPNSSIHYFGSGNPKADLQIHGAAGGSIVSIERAPDGIIAHLQSSTVNTPKIDLEIRLFDGERKIEFTAMLQKVATVKKEAAYFAFPFAVSDPLFHYEIQNGWIDPAKDMLPGACREWFSVQHWVSIENKEVAAALLPLDSSLVTLGDINRGLWPAEFGERKATIFSYVMNNYWHTNYRAAQGGDFRFRYVITSAAHLDPVALSRRGWEEMTPLETDLVQNQDKSWPRLPNLDPKQGSFLTINDSALLLQTWKTAEDGKGTIVRLLDLGGGVRQVQVEVPLLNLASVQETDAVERNQRQVPLTSSHVFQINVQPHAIVTLRLNGSSVLSPPVISGGSASMK